MTTQPAPCEQAPPLPDGPEDKDLQLDQNHLSSNVSAPSKTTPPPQQNLGSALLLARSLFPLVSAGLSWCCSCPLGGSVPAAGSLSPARGHPGLARSGSGSPRPSTTTEAPLDGSKPRDFLLLAVLSCFCPLWPINMVGLAFSVMVGDQRDQSKVELLG